MSSVRAACTSAGLRSRAPWPTTLARARERCTRTGTAKFVSASSSTSALREPAESTRPTMPSAEATAIPLDTPSLVPLPILMVSRFITGASPMMGAVRTGAGAVSAKPIILRRRSFSALASTSSCSARCSSRFFARSSRLSWRAPRRATYPSQVSSTPVMAPESARSTGEVAATTTRSTAFRSRPCLACAR